MNTLIRIVIPSLFAAGSAMAAEPIVADTPRGAPPLSTVTCVDVVADLYTWQLAGVHGFARSEPVDQVNRDQALRAPPQYAERVQKIQGRPFAAGVTR